MSSTVERFAATLQAWLDLDEDEPEVEVWDRAALFQLDDPELDAFDGQPCAGNPPVAYAAMLRGLSEGVLELFWKREEDDTLDDCPVVELSIGGVPQCIAVSGREYVEALLYTGGMLGGGSTEDLRDAREQASEVALALADELMEQLDRGLPSPERLGDRFDELQDDIGDAWSEVLDEAD